MATVVCECGMTYSPQDIYARNRHEASAKHLANIPIIASRHEKDNVTDETTPDPYADAFDDLDLEEDPTSGPAVTKVAAKIKKAVKVPKVVNVGNHKACRVCGDDKPLEEYRRKSTRPDGRDTICAVCSKSWLIAHRAKKAAVK